GVAQNVDYVRAAHAFGIVDARILPRCIRLQLVHPLVGLEQHVFFAAEVQAAGGTGLDASRLQPRAYAVRTQGALVDLLGGRVKFRNVERAPCHTVLTADAVGLVEVNDAVRVLHDGAIGGTSLQASRLFAVHALILAHEPLWRAVIRRVFVKLDQIPEIPSRLGHGLKAVVESGLAEVVSVPLHAGDLAGFATNAGGRVHQLTHAVIAGRSVAFFAIRQPVGPAAGRAAAVTGDRFDFQCAVDHGVSP